MRSETILTYVNARPFQPFRIVMNSGRAYEVRHPEFVKVTRDTVLYFFAAAPDAVVQRWEILSLLLIERLEPSEMATQPN